MWTPPGAPLNSGNAAINLNCQYNASNVGSLDIPGSTPPATIIPVPFGSISQCLFLIVQNLTGMDLGVRINGSVADNFAISTNSLVMIALPLAAASEPVTSLSINTKATPGSTVQVPFWLFGN